MSGRSPYNSILRIAFLGIGLMAVAVACSSSPSTSSSTVPTEPAGPTTTSQPSGAPSTSVATIPIGEASPAGTFGKRPTVIVPSTAPPTQLEASDLIVGTGPAVQAGQTITVQYDGYSWTSKKEFDASWNRNQPFSFPLGQGQVIQGWDQGVAGMKIGGRRELVIPPNLAYGSRSPSPEIASNDTLIFVVDLISVGS